MYRKKKIILLSPFLKWNQYFYSPNTCLLLNYLYAEFLLDGFTFASFYIGLAFITHK